MTNSSAKTSWFTTLRIAWGQFPWSLGVAMGMMIVFTPHPEWHQDLEVFRNFSDTLRHPIWTRWLFSLLAFPPEPVAFVGLSVVTTALIYFAVWVFRGKHWVVFASFAFAWTLLYGQIDGLVVGGLALAWWALQQERPVLLGAGLILASIKPQLSLPLGLALWWWSPGRVKSLLIPALVVGASLLQWGWWVPEWLQNLGSTQDLTDLSRNVSWWPVLKWWVWLIWMPIIMLRLPRPRKLIAIAAGTALTVPYFPFPSIILLLVLPIPWWIWALSQIPFLTVWFGYEIYPIMRILPLSLLLWAIYPVIYSPKSIPTPEH
jgi:hypothetical protein